MRVVVSSKGGGIDGEVSEHFGRCPEFVVLDCEGKEITGKRVVKNPHYEQHVPGAVPGFVSSLKADVMMAGGMGPRAVEIFGEHGIKVVVGVSGRIMDVVESYLSGELDAGKNVCHH